MLALLNTFVSNLRRPNCSRASLLLTLRRLPRPQAYVLARDGWDAPHLLAAMGLPHTTAASTAAAGTGANAAAAAGNAPPRAVQLHGLSGSAQAAAAAAAAGSGDAPPPPSLLPSWAGMRPATMAAARQQRQAAGGGADGGHGAGGDRLPGLDPGRNVPASAAPPVMPFVPYAPPPLQGATLVAAPGLQVRGRKSRRAVALDWPNGC